MTVHDDYGFAYPVTFIFDIPAGSSNFHAYHRHQITDSWSELTQKTSDDFFNGIEAVRFDYTNNKAYVSVAFDASYDWIYIRVTDNNGNPQARFNSIAKYYDDRKCAVCATGDNWGSLNDDENVLACNMFTSKQIWLTVGLYAGETDDPPTWATVQSKINAGYIEPGNHSRNHEHIPYSDYAEQVTDWNATIKSNLSFPALNKKGSTEYIYAWHEPWAESDSTLRSLLAANKFLISRTTTPNETAFATWASDGLFNRVGETTKAGSDYAPTGIDEEYLNDAFDATYTAGGIYHLFFHAERVDWSEGEYADGHLSYIAGKKDVWYVGFGHLYMYRYAATKAIKMIY